MFSIVYLWKMMHYELICFKKSNLPHNLKEVVRIGVMKYDNTVMSLKQILKHSDEFDRIIKTDDSEDKIMAMSSILEMLMLMPAEEVLSIENQLKEQTEVDQVFEEVKA